MPPLSNVTCASAVRSLAVLCVSILLLVAAATPAGASSRLNVRPHQKGISVRLAGKQQGTVVYFLNRHRVAVKRYAPYRAVITRGQFGNRTKQLVVARDARTGEALATTTVDTSLAPAPTASGGDKGAGRNPTVSLTAAPAGSTSSTSATFAWTANKADITTCTLDGVVRGDCASPLTYTGLAPGSHTFVVTVGNKFGASSATAAWQIMAPPPPPTAPLLTITAVPPSTTTDTTATVGFEAFGATSTWCSLDGGPEAPCTSPATYSGLAAATHQVVVSAKNLAGTTALTVSWTIMAPAPAPAAPTTTLPTLTVTSAPPATTTSTSATIAFTATGATSTTCSLDSATPVACTSPVSYNGLSVASHRLVIAARNTAGQTTKTVDWVVQSASSPPPPLPPPPSAPSGVTPPAAPASYALPSGATYVRTTAELTTALKGSNKDIVLADGMYSNSGPISVPNGNRLYAEHVGKAVLTSGLVLGGNFGTGGVLVRGLVLDVASNAQTLNGGAITAWGAGGVNASVLDTVIRGNQAVSVGLLVYSAQGLIVERLQLSGFTDVGLRASDNQVVSYGGSTPRMDHIWDVSVDGVSRATPGSSNGTGEAGVWIGHPVVNGVRRIKVRNVSYSGIETVNNAWDTTLSDLDIDMGGTYQAAGVGVYLEHFSRNLVFERFSITGARVGFNAEWADPGWGSLAASNNAVIQNGTVDSAGTKVSGRQAGVYLDYGTVATTVRGVTFKNQNWAGIGAYQTVGTNTFTANTFLLAPGAVPTSTAHI
jgi:hypothetical protein